jgi:hypothetical protein
MRFLYHLRCQAHHAIRRRTTLEPAIYTHSMVSTRTCISRWEPHDEALLVGHQLQMVIVLERDINYKTILVCLYVSLACRERAGLLFSAWLDGLSFGYDQWPLWYLLGHQLQMVVLERDINYKTILVCLYVRELSLQRESRPLVFYLVGWSLSWIWPVSSLISARSWILRIEIPLHGVLICIYLCSLLKKKLEGIVFCHACCTVKWHFCSPLQQPNRWFRGGKMIFLQGSIRIPKLNEWRIIFLYFLYWLVYSLNKKINLYGGMF